VKEGGWAKERSAEDGEKQARGTKKVRKGRGKGERREDHGSRFYACSRTISRKLVSL
jgi:hypothetical protein